MLPRNNQELYKEAKLLLIFYEMIEKEGKFAFNYFNARKVSTPETDMFFSKYKIFVNNLKKLDHASIWSCLFLINKAKCLNEDIFNRVIDCEHANYLAESLSALRLSEIQISESYVLMLIGRFENTAKKGQDNLAWQIARTLSICNREKILTQDNFQKIIDGVVFSYYNDSKNIDEFSIPDQLIKLIGKNKKLSMTDFNSVLNHVTSSQWLYDTKEENAQVGSETGKKLYQSQHKFFETTKKVTIKQHILSVRLPAINENISICNVQLNLGKENWNKILINEHLSKLKDIIVKSDADVLLPFIEYAINRFKSGSALLGSAMEDKIKVALKVIQKHFEGADIRGYKGFTDKEKDLLTEFGSELSKVVYRSQMFQLSSMGLRKDN